MKATCRAPSGVHAAVAAPPYARRIISLAVVHRADPALWTSRSLVAFGPPPPELWRPGRDSLLPANSPESRERVPINQPESTSRACCAVTSLSCSRRLLRVSVLLLSLGGRACVFASVYIPIAPHSEPICPPVLCVVLQSSSLADAEGFTAANGEHFPVKASNAASET